MQSGNLPSKHFELCDGFCLPLKQRALGFYVIAAVDRLHDDSDTNDAAASAARGARSSTVVGARGRRRWAHVQPHSLLYAFWLFALCIIFLSLTRAAFPLSQAHALLQRPGPSTIPACYLLLGTVASNLKARALR